MPMSNAEPGKAPPAVFAWLVHMFTASGAVLALLALTAIEQEQWRLALLWLFVAFMVDGIDGTFARWARTKEQAPRIDGDTVDLVVDYLTYVFVPTIFIWRAGLVPEALAPWLAAAIQFSSLYLFSRSDMKTHDNYFRGFPALWNLVAFYLFVLEAGATAGAVVVTALVALTFAPVHFVHPFRVRDYGRWLLVLALTWAVSTCALLWTGWGAEARWALQGVSIVTACTLLSLGLLRTLRGDKSASSS
jgi:phosphatidylcholine synthase